MMNFYVGTSRYTAVVGDNWKQLCEKEDTDEWRSFFGYVVLDHPDTTYVADNKGNLVSVEEKIYPAQYVKTPAKNVQINFQISAMGSYVAIRGMTWNEFVKYNSDKFSVKADGFVYMLSGVSSDEKIFYNSVAVKGTDEIVANATYSTIEN
jgi:hypothetical protein